MRASWRTGANGETGAPIPRRRPLNTLRDVQRQIATIYWDARRGTLEVTKATRLVFILDKLGNIINDGEIEKRLVEIEPGLPCRIANEARRAPSATQPSGRCAACA